ncbi:MAG: glycoside hydrolase family 9 protein [Planctomycetota bacterium]
MARRIRRTLGGTLTLLGVLALPTLAQDVVRPLVESGKPPLFAFGQWESSVMEQADGPVRLRGFGGKGGYGYNAAHDLSAHADALVRLRVQVHTGNRSRGLRVLLRDRDGTSGQFDYRLPADAGEATLKPQDAAAVAEPNLLTSDGDDAALDLRQLTQVQVIGDWRDDPLDVTVLAIDLARPDTDDLAARAAFRRRVQEANADRATRLRLALADIRRTDASPEIVHVCALAPDLIQLTVRAGTIPPVKLEPYAPRDGDRVVPDTKHEAVVWTRGQGRGELVVQGESLRLFRQIEGEDRHVGFVTGDRRFMLPAERLVGDALHHLLIDRPEGYTVSVDGQPPRPPVAVYRKSKPFNMTHPDRRAAMEHRVILRLSEPMPVGTDCVVGLPGVNTRQASVTYRHEPRTTRSDAVHVSQIGFAPGDPYKVAFLSSWLGTGGGHRYDVTRFELLDDSGRTVFEGPIQIVKDDGEPERLRETRDYAQTAVYALDFSAFAEPGNYRVLVPGVGTSGPFAIGLDAWRSAFETGMRGLLHHRSGVALGPPLTGYTRPRPHHPADGVKVFVLPTPNLAGEAKAVNEAALGLLDDPPPTLDDAWGGHMDAGDFDRNTRHLGMAHLLLELYELAPDTFDTIALAVPENERDNGLPDLIDEALWTLDFFARLQREDGGVGGGVESSAHPRDAETSWHDSLFLGAFAPDSYASYSFAATAAVAGRVTRGFDSERADGYRGAAERAWRWAERHADDDRRRFTKRAWQIHEQRELAAAELLHLTGEASYDRAFRETSAVVTGRGDVREAAAFAYARLPVGVGDDAVKAAARQAVLDLADRAIAFGDGNAFGVSTPYPDMPMLGFVGYFSTPGITSRALPRAHALTGDPKYHAATLRSANFSAGANPDNLVYTTGLGWNAPRNPLHLDHRRTGQPAPAGITVYGPADPNGGSASSEWMHTYFLADQMVPPSRTWPPQESYVDAFMWPEMAEYTIHQTIAPSVYTWGYLAAQPVQP